MPSNKRTDKKSKATTKAKVKASAKKARASAKKKAAARKANEKKPAKKKGKKVPTPKKKRCCTCGKTKQVKLKDGSVNFWKNSKSPDGLRAQCKQCFYDWRDSTKEE
jgi:hypothetical protein